MRGSANSTKQETINLIRHLQQNANNLIIASQVQGTMLKIFQELGCTEFNTPIITHGMREYNRPIAEVRCGNNHTPFYLRHSPEFEKQLIVLATGLPYIQKAPCVRPGDSSIFHVPYLHQLDVEFPFNKSTVSYEQAMERVKKDIETVIRKTFQIMGVPIKPTQTMTYDEAEGTFGTSSPHIASDDDSITLVIIEKPPFMLIKRGQLNTSILPMAQPIWSGPEDEQRFVNGEMSEGDIMKTKVYGYDFILSSKKIKKKNQQNIWEGLEVAGGSVRIDNHQVQLKVIETVRKENIMSFMPLIQLLECFGMSRRFTAGGAIGIERMSMSIAGVDHIQKIQPIPWRNSKPPFTR